MQIDTMVDELYEERDLHAYQGRHEEFERLAKQYPGKRDNQIATRMDNHKKYDILDKLFIESYWLVTNIQL